MLQTVLTLNLNRCLFGIMFEQTKERKIKLVRKRTRNGIDMPTRIYCDGSIFK